MTDTASDHTLADAQRLSGLSRKLILQLVDAGLVEPVRGPRQQYRFGFTDLAVMRAARGLAAAHLPVRRVTRALRALRASLQRHPQRSIRIVVVGDEIALVDSTGRLLTADADQYLIDFEIDPNPTSDAVAAIAMLRPDVVEPVEANTPVDDPADVHPSWQQAFEFEEAGHLDDAIDVYRVLIAIGETSAAAHANLGRLLHEQGKVAAAEAAYRRGLEAFSEDATLHFNYAVLADASGHLPLAEQHYRATLELDSGFADAHYNLALICEASGRAHEAIRHWNAWRRLGA